VVEQGMVDIRAPATRQRRYLWGVDKIVSTTASFDQRFGEGTLTNVACPPASSAQSNWGGVSLIMKKNLFRPLRPAAHSAVLLPAT
jgi:hypothetical protein